jgi:hypothetical protein
LEALHRLVTAEDGVIGDIARQLHTTIDVVRHLLTESPAELQPVSTGVKTPAQEMLTPGIFRSLYTEERLTLTAIARRFGISPGTTREIAREYGIKIRPPGPAQTTIDPDWLHRQIVTREQSFTAIANTLRGEPTHGRPPSQTGIQPPQRAHPQIEPPKWGGLPAILKPAINRGGWDRLQRFVAAYQYRTLTEAASGLGVYGTPLRRQIAILERDLGSPLITRALRDHPMSPTAFGAQVAAAVRAHQTTVDADR